MTRQPTPAHCIFGRDSSRSTAESGLLALDQVGSCVAPSAYKEATSLSFVWWFVGQKGQADGYVVGV